MIQGVGESGGGLGGLGVLGKTRLGGGAGGVQIGQIPLEGLPGEGFQAWKEVPGKTPDGSGDSPGSRKLKLLCLEDCPHELPLERQELMDG